MKKLRIAVAGAGMIGRRHIELIGDSEECELAAIVDESARMRLPVSTIASRF